MEWSWPLTGRDAELRRVNEALRPGAAGILVAGPAGVGKTRLVHESLARVAQGTRVVWAYGSAAARPYPLGAFADLLDVPAEDGTAEVTHLLGELTRQGTVRARRGRRAPARPALGDRAAPRGDARTRAGRRHRPRRGAGTRPGDLAVEGRPPPPPRPPPRSTRRPRPPSSRRCSRDPSSPPPRSGSGPSPAALPCSCATCSSARWSPVGSRRCPGCGAGRRSRRSPPSWSPSWTGRSDDSTRRCSTSWTWSPLLNRSRWRRWSSSPRRPLWRSPRCVESIRTERRRSGRGSDSRTRCTARYAERRWARLRARRLRGLVAPTLDSDADPIPRALLMLDSDLAPDPALSLRAAEAAIAFYDLPLAERLARAAAASGDWRCPAGARLHALLAQPWRGGGSPVARAGHHRTGRSDAGPGAGVPRRQPAVDPGPGRPCSCDVESRPGPPGHGTRTRPAGSHGCGPRRLRGRRTFGPGSGCALARHGDRRRPGPAAVLVGCLGGGRGDRPAGAAEDRRAFRRGVRAAPRNPAVRPRRLAGARLPPRR